MPNNAASLSTYTTMMRVTSTGRPYCQDLNDLFAALVIQHGLRDHRYRFRTIPASFVLSEATDVLGHLQFTHVMKTPDPANPSRLIATRTTTTFSMSPNMARTLAQFFATSRLIENAVDPTNRVMKDKAIWVLTPKGKFALQNFSRRAQVSIESLQPALAKVDSFDIVVLERLPDHDDKLAFARPNMTVAFKTLMAYLPLESLLADDAGGIDKEDLEEYRYAFYGYQAFEWISEYTTVVTREEAEMVAAEFVLYGWISQVLDKSDSENNKRDDSVIFKMTRNTLYHVTLRGRQVLGWDKPKQSPSHSQLEDHEYILKKQKALAARLKNGDMPPPTIQSVPAKSKLTVQSSAASTTSVSTESSSVSSDSTSSTQQTATGSDNATVTKFTGNEQLEINMPGEQPADMKATKPKDNLDEVTEKLLQLRSPSDHGSGSGSGGGEDSTTIKMKRIESEDGQQTSTTIVSSSSSSPSRPSSMVFASAFAAQDTTDFITSAPLDGNQQLDPHSHWAKLRQILEDPLVRMYFRDFMKSQFCEENVNIWVDYHTLRKKCRKGSAPPKELLKDAFVIYDTYLAPGAKSEVNIDHSLRQEIISYITSVFEIRDVDGQAQSGSVPFMTSAYQPQPQQITIVLTGNTNECLRTLLKLYDRVNEHICRIMAQDSVPKFIKTNKYRELMANPPPPMCHDSTESGH